MFKEPLGQSKELFPNGATIHCDVRSIAGGVRQPIEICHQFVERLKERSVNTEQMQNDESADLIVDQLKVLCGVGVNGSRSDRRLCGRGR